jgi:SMC interacting uncharacterized protein involved in chromosome segregation
MTHLGQRVDGKYTRKSLAAEKANEFLVQVEKRRSDLAAINSEIKKLTAEYEEMTRTIKDRDGNLADLKRSVAEAKEDLLRQNPSADVDRLNHDYEVLVSDFLKRYSYAQAHIEEMKQTLTVKLSAARRHEDRIEHYRKQLETVLKEGFQEAA